MLKWLKITCSPQKMLQLLGALSSTQTPHHFGVMAWALTPAPPLSQNPGSAPEIYNKYSQPSLSHASTNLVHGLVALPGGACCC